MKASKGFLVLPILTLLAAAGSFLLRKGQIVHAFEPTGLLTAGSGYTYALAAVWLAMAMAAAVLSLKSGRRVKLSIKAGLMDEGYTPYFHQSFPAACVTALGGAGMALGGALAVSRWVHMALSSKLDLCWGAVMLLAGLSVVYGAFRLDWGETGAGLFAWELLMPVAAGCLWLFAIYQQHTANPCVWEYAPLLLGVVCATAAALGAAAFSYEKVRPMLTLMSASLGVVLLAAALADCLYFTADPFRAAEGMTLPYELALGGVMIWLMSRMTTLSYRLLCPKRVETDPDEGENGPDVGANGPDADRNETENHQDTL